MDAVLIRRDVEPKPVSACSTVRSVFISDTHFGCAYAKADRLLRFLSRLRPEFIYLVGDFIDGWELRRRWRWSPEVTQVLRFLMDVTGNSLPRIRTWNKSFKASCDDHFTNRLLSWCRSIDANRIRTGVHEVKTRVSFQ